EKPTRSTLLDRFSASSHLRTSTRPERSCRALLSSCEEPVRNRIVVDRRRLLLSSLVSSERARSAAGSLNDTIMAERAACSAVDSALIPWSTKPVSIRIPCAALDSETLIRSDGSDPASSGPVYRNRRRESGYSSVFTLKMSGSKLIWHSFDTFRALALRR